MFSFCADAASVASLFVVGCRWEELCFCVCTVNMSDNQLYEMGNDEFQQDGGDQQYEQQDDQMNGEGAEECAGGDAPADSGSAEAPGRDDDR